MPFVTGCLSCSRRLLGAGHGAGVRRTARNRLMNYVCSSQWKRFGKRSCVPFWLLLLHPKQHRTRVILKRDWFGITDGLKKLGICKSTANRAGFWGGIDMLYEADVLTGQLAMLILTQAGIGPRMGHCRTGDIFHSSVLCFVL